MRYRRADLAWASLLVLAAGLSLSELIIGGSGSLLLVMAVPAYLAGRRLGSLSPALWALAGVAVAGLTLAFWRSSEPLSAWLTVVTMEFVGAVLPWWVGRYQHLRREHRERERIIVAEQARLRERARIAQDMHDSLGHELALIALHGGALELAGDLTDDQRRAAAELRAGAVRATDRLHDIVRVLGTADAADALRPPDETIDDLVRRATAAGLPVRLRADGPPPAWSPMTSQAAHRVVQEALTNAARHAPGAPVTVTVSRAGTETRIDVVNETHAQRGDDPGTGLGLIGLHERVRLAGGRLDAGPRPDGRWAVSAVLPDSSGSDADSQDVRHFELRATTRLTRRRQLKSAALPIATGIGLVGALLIAQQLTLTRTGLADGQYDDLRLGQSWSQLEPVLPQHTIERVPRLIDEPPRPAGADCLYYHAGNTLADLGSELYRLCFADGVLVAKHRLEQV